MATRTHTQCIQHTFFDLMISHTPCVTDIAPLKPGERSFTQRYQSSFFVCPKEEKKRDEKELPQQTFLKVKSRVILQWPQFSFRVVIRTFYLMKFDCQSFTIRRAISIFCTKIFVMMYVVLSTLKQIT